MLEHTVQRSVKLSCIKYLFNTGEMWFKHADNLISSPQTVTVYLLNRLFVADLQ